MATTELWLISGRDPVRFQLPCYVKIESGTEFEITSALPLLLEQQKALERILFVTARRVGSRWLIKDPALRRIAKLVSGGDPMTYFVWGTPPPEIRKPTEDKTDRTEFTDELFNRGVGESPEHAAFLMKEICLTMADWLINKEKPVDLIFAKLHNCPYRANWKVILTQRFRHLGKILNRTSGVAFNYALDRSGFREELLSLDLLAINRRDETCYRHIEVEHTRKWWKLQRQVEKQRRAMAGPCEYADYFLDSIKRFIRRAAIPLYTSWLAQIADYCVADCESGFDGRIRFVPNYLAGKLHWSDREYCGLAPVIPNKPPKFKPASVARHLLAPDVQLPPLSAVQSQVADVRNGDHQRPGPALDQSRNGTG